MPADTKTPDVEFWMAQATLADGRTGVVEVIRNQGAVHPHLVLLSELLDGRLHCLIAFTRDAVLCDAMSARGFVCIESLIYFDDEDCELKVHAAAFVPDQREIKHDQEWLSVVGVTFGAGAEVDKFERHYQQVLTSPDLVLPAENVRMVTTTWPLKRRDVLATNKSSARVTIAKLRWPKTLPLEEAQPEAVWTGTIDRLKDGDIWGKPTRSPPRRERRPEEFRSHRSSFRAVEVLGARVEVPRYDARRRFGDNIERQDQQEEEFYGLISPLNFHLPSKGESEPPYGSRPDFYYRPATSGLTIELLRYGQMSVAESIGGMEPDDIQSQHELLVRVVVGRVDEDSGQAQEVSTFVPALFVDNTWSKHMGRQYMGLDKRLAYFCTKNDGKLVPLSAADACDLRDPPPPPLWRIAEIRLAKGLYPPLPKAPDPEDAGDTAAAKAKKKKEKKAFEDAKAAREALMDAKASPVLLTIECDRDLIDGWDDFQAVPTDAVLRASPLAARRWRQEDFDDPEVRRDFARAAGQGSAGGFLGTQCSPLPADPKRDETGKLIALSKDEMEERWAAQTWVSGRYSMTGSAMMARPKGKITVTLHRVPNDPVEAWEHLCNLFEVPTASRGGQRTFVLGPGAWYRLQYDMELAMQNGLG